MKGDLSRIWNDDKTVFSLRILDVRINENFLLFLVNFKKEVSYRQIKELFGLPLQLN